jgi:CheY-like chemotaxis protein
MASLSHPVPRGRSVLYIEDDPHDFFLLHVANHKCGAPFSLRQAEDGEQAIAYLSGIGPYENREKYPFPDLVLLDLRMPKLDGFEVLQWIRTNQGTTTVPVVVLAGSGFRADMRRALELGANSCITKPPESEKLRLVIDQLASLLMPLSPPNGASRSRDGLRA